MVLADGLPFPIVGPAPGASLEALADETLMSRFRDGDPQAFETLYRRHRAAVHRFVRRLCPADADEIFQDVWLAVIKGKSRYVASARFATYLFAIAHHRAVARLRRRGRAAELLQEDDPLADETPGPLDMHINAELAQALEAAIAALPLAQREAFLMRAEGGLGLEEIAEAAGTSRETVKSRLRYATRRLRQALGDWR